ncbi:protein kinase domain-containing protein [Sorangium sp. So ce861]|uniref:serine/threonine-protein kinase n=1 Tax=Sorangium sp. So ce861 TaxID=3133323 RepID=UPI003F6400F1
MRSAPEVSHTQDLQATPDAPGRGAPPGEGDERAAGARRSFRPGDIVAGHYRLERLLGEGGMGVVWAASHARTGARVALKFVKGVSGAVHLRLLREARIAHELDHPNVVAVHDVALEDGAPVMVMELLSGESLADRLSRGPRMCLPEVASIFMQVVSAVGAAHARGVIHRDLKPENIFLVDGSSQRVKVLDFGIAKLTAASGHDARTPGLTESGTRLGTPCYMSPEQVFGDPVDHRTDIWSLGLLLYECLSGDLPTRADNAGQVFKIIVTGGIPPLESAAPGVPPELASLVRSMLSVARDARPSDLCEVHAALAALAQQAAAPSSGAPASPAPVPSGPPVKAPAGEAVEGDEVDPMAPTQRPNAPPPPAEPRSTGRRTAVRAAAWAIGLAVALAGLVAVALAWREGPAPVEERPPPRASNPRALSRYAAALEAVGDANEGEAAERLRQAIALDDALAAAHLRLAIYAPDRAEARRHYARAEALRDGLDPRERALLHAMEPLLGGDPGDAALCAARLSALAAQRPGDAEVLALLARHALRWNIHASVEAAARATTSEPQRAQGWAALARSLRHLGSFQDAAAAVDQCLAISPQAASCYEVRSEIHSALGSCGEVEHDLQLMLWMTGTRGQVIQRKLASSSYAQGRSADAVMVPLRQGWVSLPDSERRYVALIDEASVRALTGDFAEAEVLLRSARLRMSAESRAHADVARALVDIYLETDREIEAARIAETCLDNYVACASGSADLLRVMLHAGFISWAAFQERRADHLPPSGVPAGAERGLSALVRAHARWIEGFEEAAEAVPALPVSALMSDLVDHDVHADLGAVYHLAGMPGHAIPALHKAVMTCDMLDWPVTYVRSFWFLGQALEQTGDTPGACQAYASVIERWGGASPPSQTAARARERSRALGCGPID